MRMIRVTRGHGVFRYVRGPRDMPYARGARPGGRSGGVRPRGAARRVLAAVAGALWWWAALRLALWPDGAGPWQAAVGAGWSLGLIPLHAVPLGQARRAVAAGGSGTGPRRQRGHR